MKNYLIIGAIVAVGLLAGVALSGYAANKAAAQPAS